MQQNIFNIKHFYSLYTLYLYILYSVYCIIVLITVHHRYNKTKSVDIFSLSTLNTNQNIKKIRPDTIYVDIVYKR